ncbi:MAG: hypothetical protein JSS61_01120 [Verrucomicrobia bacterium]|nr:hypothetical protein [Verrucomicrobiota bacterium]
MAILPALGIGDGLLMLIAAHHLRSNGFAPTLFHADLPQLAPFFPGFTFEVAPTALETFDQILVENDNSPHTRALIALREEGKLPGLAIYYPTYSEKKHGQLAPVDRVFDPQLSMAENIACAVGSSTKDNGISPPSHLKHRAHPRRILLHPMSRASIKNWKASGYLRVGEALRKKGYSPLICLGPGEKWELGDIDVISPHNLSELAALIYESGAVIGNDSLLGHLASNLDIPTVTIADDAERMKLWRPGWRKGALVLPPRWLPKWKLVRTHWQQGISVKRVLNAFDEVMRPF